jgi:hypothetical protein
MKIRIKDPAVQKVARARWPQSRRVGRLRPGNGVPILHDRDRRLFDNSELIGADGGGLQSFLSDPNPTCE